MSSANGTFALRLFPSYILETIARFLDGDELINLFLSGDRAFFGTLRQISTVTAVWKSSAPCRWNSLSPFLSAFPHLHAVAIRLSSPHQLPSEPFNVDFLPLNLGSLSLAFRGALGCLASKQTFLHLQSLTNLSIVQQSAPLFSNGLVIDLTQFPKALQRLRLSSASSHLYTYNIDDLDKLPTDLRSLDLDLSPSFPGHQRTIRPMLSNLKHLSLKGFYRQSYSVDIIHIGAHLESLDVPELLYNGAPLPRLFGGTGEPLRDILPRLHTFILRTPGISLRMMETLPNSITKLGGSFFSKLDVVFDDPQICRELNESHLSAREAKLEPCCAPIQLRRFVLFERELIGDYLPHFSSLEDLEVPFVLGSIEWRTLPRNLRTINANRITGPVALLPRYLTSLSCSTFVIDNNKSDYPLIGDENASIDAQLPFKLPYLAHLSIRGSHLTHAMISFLPETMVRIDVVIATQDVLEAVTNKFNNSLDYLRIKVHNDLSDPSNHVLIGSTTIPRGLKSLEIVGNYELAPPQSSRSLLHHPNLTFLRAASPAQPSVLLPQLPKTLLRLSCVLNDQVDLNDDSMLQTVVNLPQSLRELRISIDSDLSNPKGWFRHSHPLPFRSLLPHFLSTGPEFRFRLLRALPSTWVSRLTFLKATERFIHSRLPRRLSEFQAPFLSIQDADYELSLVENAVELFTLTSPLDVLQRILATRLPLIGTLLPRMYRSDCDVIYHPPPYVSRISTLPPRLQDLNIGTSALDQAYFDRTREGSRQALQSAQEWAPERISFRIVFHCLNLIAWLHLRSFLQIDRNAHPLAWYFAWINILGSSCAIPLQLFAHSEHIRKRLAFGLRGPKGAKETLLWLLIGLIATTPAIGSLGLLWTTNYATAIAFDFTPSRWSLPSRAIALGFSLLGETLIHWISSRLMF